MNNSIIERRIRVKRKSRVFEQQAEIYYNGLCVTRETLDDDESYLYDITWDCLPYSLYTYNEKQVYYDYIQNTEDDYELNLIRKYKYK